MINYAGKTNINVQEITIIPITDEDEGTYSTALDLTGRARSASYTPNVKETKLYGDGEVQEKVIDATEGTLTLALNYLTDSDRQTLFGDGDEISSRFFVTFGIFGKDNTQVNNLYETLKILLKNGGFTRSGTLYTSDSDFPKYFRISADFNIDL